MKRIALAIAAAALALTGTSAQASDTCDYLCKLKLYEQQRLICLATGCTQTTSTAPTTEPTPEQSFYDEGPPTYSDTSTATAERICTIKC